MLKLARSGGHLLVTVRVMPRAASGVIGGERDGALIVRVTAAPVGGAANTAVVRILAKALGVPPSEVRIVRGATARTKVVSVPAAAEDALARLL